MKKNIHGRKKLRKSKTAGFISTKFTIIPQALGKLREYKASNYDEVTNPFFICPTALGLSI